MTRIQFNSPVAYEPVKSHVGPTEERGIRTHNAFTAFFKNIFAAMGMGSKVFAYKCGDQKLYINHVSFNHWIERKVMPFNPEAGRIPAHNLKNMQGLIANIFRQAFPGNVINEEDVVYTPVVDRPVPTDPVPAPAPAPAPAKDDTKKTENKKSEVDDF